MKNLTEENQRLENALKKIFTDGQIKKLKKLDERIKSLSGVVMIFHQQLIFMQLVQEALNTNLKKNSFAKHINFKRWAKKINMRSGILHDVLKLMKNFDFDEKQKLCTLSFDEMKIKHVYEYDKTSDTLLKSSNYVQVAMVRGLISKWKQPVFYNYDSRITKFVLNDISIKLYEVRYTVVSIVSDMAPNNRKLWMELQIGLLKM